MNTHWKLVLILVLAIMIAMLGIIAALARGHARPLPAFAPSNGPTVIVTEMRMVSEPTGETGQLPVAGATAVSPAGIIDPTQVPVAPKSSGGVTAVPIHSPDSGALQRAKQVGSGEVAPTSSTPPSDSASSAPEVRMVSEPTGETSQLPVAGATAVSPARMIDPTKIPVAPHSSGGVTAVPIHSPDPGALQRAKQGGAGVVAPTTGSEAGPDQS